MKLKKIKMQIKLIKTKTVQTEDKDYIKKRQNTN